MKRSSLACLKHITFAIIALGFILCAVEAGLRVYVATHGGQLSPEDSGESLIVRSWSTHHGMKPLSTATCRHSDTGAPIVIRTNSYAIRGPEPAVPKPPEVFRVLCLGDETTLSADVELPQTFCGRVEEMLQPHCRFKLEVINAGVPGYCPLLSYLQVRHSLAALQPDLIILNFDMGDIAEDYRYRRHTHLAPTGDPLACPNPAFIKRSASKKPSVVDEFLLIRWGKSQLASLQLTDKRPEDSHRIDSGLARYAWLTDKPPDWSIHIEQALAPIEHLQQLCLRHDARLAVAVYPAPWQVSADATSGGKVRERLGIASNAVFRSRTPFDTLKRYSDEHSIAFHDASPAFQTAQQPEQLYLNNAARFSPAGHNLYARELARLIYRMIPEVWNNNTPSNNRTQPIRNALRPR